MPVVKALVRAAPKRLWGLTVCTAQAAPFTIPYSISTPRRHRTRASIQVFETDFSRVRLISASDAVGIDGTVCLGFHAVLAAPCKGGDPRPGPGAAPCATSHCI